MGNQKPYRFVIDGYEAILLNGQVEISLPDEDIASKILIKMSNGILDKKLKSLRINLPNKIIFVSAHDRDNILVRAEEANDKKAMN